MPNRIIERRNGSTSLGIACLAVSLVGCAAPVARSTVDERVGATVPVLMEKYRVPGVAVALIEEGRLASELAFGYSNLASETRARPSTIFEAASLGKPLFAYAVVQRAVAGEIDLDAEVDADLNVALPPVQETRGITVAHLLSHTSGLVYRDDERRRLLTARPGSTWRYSGLDYLVLQRALEETYGEPLDALVESVTRPLGMRETSYSWSDESRETVGYDREGNEIRPTLWDSANAASSLRTNVVEYARFVESVFADLAAGEELATVSQLMLRPRVDADASRGLAWGLGWGLAHQGHESFFLHWGSNPGFKSLVLASIERRRAMVVLTNADNGLELATELTEEVFDRKYEFLDFYMLHPDD
jgi:CubicO group peptidase (beta-lactamase class C family)